MLQERSSTEGKSKQVNEKQFPEPEPSNLYYYDSEFSQNQCHNQPPATSHSFQ